MHINVWELDALMNSCPRYVLLDRDGVINDNQEYYILAPERFRFLPGVLEALALLHAAGYRVVIVSNQSAIGKGMLTHEQLDLIHDRMLAQVRACGGEIEDILYCSDVDGARKKPAPGMLLEAAVKHGISLRDTWFIGDSWTDVAAGRAAGCKTLLVGNDAENPGYVPDQTAPDLLSAVRDAVLGDDDPPSPGMPRGKG